MRAVVLLVFLLLGWPASAAVEPDEFLADPVLETRARALSKQIRCLVCQSEAIDTSNADLARDLRILVRERIEAGDSDKEVLDYLVARYGDFVLLNPPLKLKTVLLWFGPFIALGGGIVVLLYLVRRRQGATEGEVAPLDPEERARLARLLETEQTP